MVVDGCHCRALTGNIQVVVSNAYTVDPLISYVQRCSCHHCFQGITACQLLSWCVYHIAIHWNGYWCFPFSSSVAGAALFIYDSILLLSTEVGAAQRSWYLQLIHLRDYRSPRRYTGNSPSMRYYVLWYSSANRNPGPRSVATTTYPVMKLMGILYFMWVPPSVIPVPLTE